MKKVLRDESQRACTYHVIQQLQAAPCAELTETGILLKRLEGEDGTPKGACDVVTAQAFAPYALVLVPAMRSIDCINNSMVDGGKMIMARTLLHQFAGSKTRHSFHHSAWSAVSMNLNRSTCN